MTYFCSVQRHLSAQIEPERLGTPVGDIPVVPLPPALEDMLAKITRRLKARGIEADAAELLAEEE